MRAVARPARFRNRREAHAVPQPEGHRLRQFAGDHRVIRGPHPERRRRSHLELLRPEFRQERVRDHPRLPHRRQQHFAEYPLAAIPIQLVGLRRMRRDAAVSELLLERREQPQTRLSQQPVDRTAQDVARTEIPRRAFQSPDVAQKEMLRRAALERNQYAGGGIRNEKHFTLGAECRDLNRAERRHENIRRREPDPALQPRRQVGRGKALAAKMPGQIAGSDEDNRFALHGTEITTLSAASGAKQEIATHGN